MNSNRFRTISVTQRPSDLHSILLSGVWKKREDLLCMHQVLGRGHHKTCFVHKGGVLCLHHCQVAHAGWQSLRCYLRSVVPLKELNPCMSTWCMDVTKFWFGGEWQRENWDYSNSPRGVLSQVGTLLFLHAYVSPTLNHRPWSGRSLGNHLFFSLPGLDGASRDLGGKMAGTRQTGRGCLSIGTLVCRGAAQRCPHHGRNATQGTAGTVPGRQRPETLGSAPRLGW